MNAVVSPFQVNVQLRIPASSPVLHSWFAEEIFKSDIVHSILPLPGLETILNIQGICSCLQAEVPL
jgi:hypothetical protein